jgi:hypothetical protein
MDYGLKGLAPIREELRSAERDRIGQRPEPLDHRMYMVQQPCSELDQRPLHRGTP